ncbi:MAG: 3-dehydroquinate synthase [Bacteroidales bacterium]
MYKQIKLRDHHIISGKDALDIFKTLFESSDYKDRAIFLLMDDNTNHHCLPLLRSYLAKKAAPPGIIIPCGEEHKNLHSCERLWNFLQKHQADRNAVLVNLGGGVITDIGGFAASTYKRGISFINIPTTLMGMIDAAIGGKTAVNLQKTKNQIGTFAQPDSVYIYPGFLNTLPKKELESGYAEILKHALIADKNLWEVLKLKAIENINTLEDLINYAVLIKAEIVEQDPYEKNIRKTLNFGHTFGHAFESLAIQHDNPITHGKAIAAGMICESYLSYAINQLDKTELSDIQKTIEKTFSLPGIKTSDINSMTNYMYNDKKNQKGKINCSLIAEPGKAKYDQLIPEELINEALNYYIDRMPKTGF